MGWGGGLEAASGEGLSSHLLVQPQELAVAHPTVQDSIHVNVIGLRTQKSRQTSQGRSPNHLLPPRNLARSCLTDPSVESCRDFPGFSLSPPPPPPPAHAPRAKIQAEGPGSGETRTLVTQASLPEMTAMSTTGRGLAGGSNRPKEPMGAWDDFCTKLRQERGLPGRFEGWRPPRGLRPVIPAPAQL